MSKRTLVVAACLTALVVAYGCRSNDPVQPAGDAGLSATGEPLAASISQMVAYRVTITNVTTGQPLSPPVAATHRPSVRMFRVGRLASPEIEAIAEDGNQGPMVAALGDHNRVTEVVDVGRPLTPWGTTFMDFTDMATFDIHARPGDRISLATMLICSNDGFTGLDRARLPRHGKRHYYIRAYDAGTENNTEQSMDIVDPCSALGPMPLNGDPNGNEDDAVDTSPHKKIRRHRGIHGGGDLSASDHDWDGPIARVTIERIGEDDDSGSGKSGKSGKH